MRVDQPSSDGRLLVAALAAFVVVAALAAIDLVSDVGEGISLGHAAAEGSVIAIGLVGVVVVSRRLLASERRARAAADETRALAAELDRSRGDAARWRAEAKGLLDGLSAAVDQQFERWELSPAEKEVALLLLKGLSHKEVAEARSVTEATARQQARSVYKKAGLSGRHDLSAFFLEDLMLPPSD